MNGLTKFNIVIMAILVVIAIWLALLQGSINSFKYIFEVIQEKQDNATKAIQTAQKKAIKTIQASIDFEKTNTQLQAMLADAETRLATLHQKTSHAKQNLDRLNQETENKLNTHLKAITKTQQELERLIERKTQILADIQSDKNLLELKQHLNVLNKGMTQIQDELTQINQQKDKILSDIESAKQLAEAENRLLALNQGITQATQNISQITKQKDKILSETQMADKLAQADNQLNTLSGKIAQTQQELEQMIQLKETISSEAQTTKNELAKAKQKLEVLTQNSLKTRQELNSLAIQKNDILVELQKTMMVLHDSFGTAHSKITTIITKTIEDEPALRDKPKKEELAVAEPKESQTQKPVSDETPVVKETLTPATEEPFSEVPVITEEPVAFTPKKVVNKNGKTFSDILRDESLGPKMVWIPKGKFQMGELQSQWSRYDQPVQEISIKQRFAIGVYEVTFAQYDKFAQTTGRQKPNDEGWGRHNHPVINVSFNDAIAYTQWLSEQTGQTYRLPTETEWEYTARAGTETLYWWGNHIGVNQTNCNKDCADEFKFTSPVGHFSPNPFGLYDVVGNVREWSCSAYGKVYSGNEHVCTTHEKTDRVLRGGAWFLDMNNVRIANRYRQSPDKRHIGVGFRVVREQ